MTNPTRPPGLMTRTRLGGALLLVAVLPGCTEASGESGPPPEVLRGREVYQEQFCGTCHTLTSAETAGMFGTTHDDMAGTAEDRLSDPSYTGSAETARAYLLESIVEPAAFRAPGFERTRFVMPSYEHLPDEDLDALVEMLIRENHPE